MVEFRSATDSDFDAIAGVLTVCWPHQSRGASELRSDAASLEPHLVPRFWVAEVEGRVVGTAEAYRDIGSYDPLRWTIEVSVLPDHRGRTAGSSLYELAKTFVESVPHALVSARVHERDLASIRFAEKRGFGEVKRDFVSELDLVAAEVMPFEVEGITIVPADVIDSDSFRIAFHGLFEEIRRDVPRTAPPSPLSLAFFTTHVIGDPSYLMSATHIAMEGPELVGFSGAFRSSDPGVIDQWLTGVRRRWRGRGIGRALKIAGIRWAKAHGYLRVRTDNDSRNAPMLTINASLGFVRRAGIIWMERPTFGVPPSESRE